MILISKLLENIFSLFIVSYVFFIAYILGKLIAKKLIVDPIKLDSCLYLQYIGLGIILISHFMFLLGALGLYKKSFIWGSSLALLVLLSKKIIEEINRIILFFSNLNKNAVSLSGFNILLALFFLFMLVAALSPPFAVDTISYHLLIPKEYLRKGAIYFIPYFNHNMPQGIEMLYLLGIALYNDSVSMLLNAGLGILAACSIISFCNHRYSLRVGLIAALVFLSIPSSVWYLSFSGKINLGLFFFTLLAYFSFVEWSDSKELFYLILSACFTGFAASIKLTGNFIFVSIFFLILIHGIINRYSFKLVIKSLFIYGIFFILVALPWYLKNLIFTGDPIWPLLSKVIPYSEIVQANFPSLGKGIIAWLLGPINLNLKMSSFFQKGGIGPLFFIYIPLALLIAKIRRSNFYIFMFCLVFYTLWFCFAHDGAYLMPALVLLTIPVAHVLEYLWQSKNTYTKLFVKFSFYSWMGVSLAAFFYRLTFSIPVVFGFEPKMRFIERATPFLKDISWINTHLSDEDKILSDTGSLYYLDKDFILNNYALALTAESEASKLDYYGLYKTANDEELFNKIRNELKVNYIFKVFDKPMEIACLKDTRMCNFLFKYGELTYSNANCYLPTSVVLNQRKECYLYLFKI